MRNGKEPAAMPRSAVVIVASEVEPLVDTFRRKYDPVARRGMPAHITLLWPFAVPPITDDDRAGLREIARQSPSFDYALSTMQRFPNVLWLAPNPADRFIALTHRLVQRWPSRVPYGGEHAELIPHLTVAQGKDSTLDKVEDAIAPQLPVQAHAKELTLLTESEGRWSVFERYPLLDEEVRRSNS
jgi:2'-5' RNA ligase